MIVKESLDTVLKMVRDHYSEMIDVPREKRNQIYEWIKLVEKGNEEAKKKLITDVETYLNDRGIYLTESIYPATTPYESVIYATYGLGVYDAVIHLSPFVESVLIAVGQPVRYYENGVKKSYDGYIPTEQEVEALQRKLQEITGASFHRSKPFLSGFIEETETRIQMYMPPFSYERNIITRRFVTKSFSLDDIKMDERAREFCKQVVKGRLNVAIGGGQGTGKTQRQISMLMMKDPEKDTITTFESEHELRLAKKWPGNVFALQSIEDLGYDDTYRHIFRNNSETIVFAEVRSEIEAHYALYSCLRGADATYFSIHLRIPEPEAAVRTFANMVNAYRKDHLANVYRDIAAGVDLFWLLTNDRGNRVDEAIFIPTFQEGYVTEKGDYVPGREGIKMLAKYDRAKKELVWTGEMLPADKVERMIYPPGEADLDVLRELRLTDYRRMI
ncbi:MAG: Flp pilus assembly complex ATPase component TadA [Brevibacillus sp.]|nr:Flp pilus assembly complex ATPase component TadA [Brevibacillus sp.]